MGCNAQNKVVVVPGEVCTQDTDDAGDKNSAYRQSSTTVWLKGKVVEWREQDGRRSKAKQDSAQDMCRKMRLPKSGGGTGHQGGSKDARDMHLLHGRRRHTERKAGARRGRVEEPGCKMADRAGRITLLIPEAVETEYGKERPTAVVHQNEDGQKCREWQERTTTETKPYLQTNAKKQQLSRVREIWFVQFDPDHR
ncbi:uncharacterized protein SPSK_01966 [Sporothrix schenckii 1099-18]|uniref:Uncharacterized protein n=1 Tax=Sporothrix schenckii 1099-18 TaxID=1397361 RepID=A0A0F2MDQ3_SPOSC|nr:uncharacterized protein SPSK_01966 [Sporothrix schenckii 1099-18]KJR86960.1 hypothetical protein SPSK_01966 [Sporothrix schenckii 1099-18]